tara:strand:- start:220 stop:468 length:249 start_codon:yes stop_codon:yes gene_type:complete
MSKLKNTVNRNLYIEKFDKLNVSIGSCIKIKNSKKTFQILGINKKKSICWIREWPLKNSLYETFSLPISKITLSTVCQSEKS